MSAGERTPKYAIDIRIFVDILNHFCNLYEAVETQLAQLMRLENGEMLMVIMIDGCKIEFRYLDSKVPRIRSIKVAPRTARRSSFIDS